MTPERWQHAESLARAALERPPAERPAFLAEGCAGDEQLRRSVESLLSFHGRAGSPDHPARPPRATDEGQLSTVRVESLAGRVLGPYRVEREIGRGGMGEVYLARDTRLDRHVALKLLPASLTSDAGRVRRFEREGGTVNTRGRGTGTSEARVGTRGAVGGGVVGRRRGAGARRLSVRRVETRGGPVAPAVCEDDAHHRPRQNSGGGRLARR